MSQAATTPIAPEEGKSLQLRRIVIGALVIVVEGVATAAAVADLAGQLAIELPIIAAVDGVLHRGMAIDMMIDGLLSRPYRSE